MVSVAADQADKTTLNLNLIVPIQASFIGGVRSLERNRISGLAEAFQRCFLSFDQSHNDIAVVRRICFPDDNHITVTVDDYSPLRLEREVEDDTIEADTP